LTHRRAQRGTVEEATGMQGDTIDGLGQIARNVADLAAASAWYRDVLGLPHLYSFGQMAFFDCGGVRLMLAEDPAAAAPSLLYFRVGDIHAACAGLQARGATLRSAPHLIHTHDDGSQEWMAFIDDNQGRPLGLMARTGAGSAA
jgi:catechol 2,3-dioxygenase-like lactoylglutathione lyase family enzyme